MPRKPRSCSVKKWRPMTDDQKKLAEENHNLIFGYLTFHKLDQEEYYGIAAIGLCKAAMTYKPGKYTFATYAYRCMGSEVVHYHTTQSRPCRCAPEPLLSLNAKVGESENSVEFGDLLGIDEDITRVEAEEIISRLPQKYADDIRQYMNGATKSEISRMHGFSTRAFYERMKVVKRLIAEMNLDV